MLGESVPPLHVTVTGWAPVYPLAQEKVHEFVSWMDARPAQELTTPVGRVPKFRGHTVGVFGVLGVWVCGWVGGCVCMYVCVCVLDGRTARA